MTRLTTLKVECMYCHKRMGEIPGKGCTGTTSGICQECWAACFPDEPYPGDNDNQVLKAYR